MFRGVTCVGIAAAAAMGCGAALAGPAASLQQIAVHGDAPPSGGGVMFGFSQTMLGNGSDIAFRTPLSGSSAGSPALFMRGPGGLMPAVEFGEAGDASPDGDGEIGNISPAIAAANNRIAFYADIMLDPLDVPEGPTPPDADRNSGLFRSTTGGVNLISREGQSAAGNGEFLTWTVPLINDDGNVAFTAILRETLAGELDNRAIYLGDDSEALSEIVREGDASPDGDGVFLFLDAPALNNANRVSFRADLSGTDGGAADNAGIFIGDTGGLDVIVRKGDPAPGGNGAFAFLSSQSLDSAGNVAFYAELTATAGGVTDDSGIFVGDGATVVEIAREGDAEPGGNGDFDFFYDPVIVGGKVAFAAQLRNTAGGAADDYGVYLHDGVSLELIVREGDAAPGTMAGVFVDTSDPIVNEAGQVVFVGDLDNVSDLENGIWGTTPSGLLVPIVVAGDEIEVAPGEELQVRSAEFVNHAYSYLSGGEDGHRAFDADGRLAMRVTFLDWTPGLYIAQLPIAFCAEDCEPPQGDQQVSVTDVVGVVGSFGFVGPNRHDVSPYNGGNTVGDNAVTIRDVLAVISAFGPCPGP